MGMLLGLDTLVSQAFGAGRLDECHRWLLHGVCARADPRRSDDVGCCPARRHLDRWGMDPDVLRLTRPYLDAVAWSRRRCCSTSRSVATCRASASVRPIMVTLIVANLLNVVVNWMLIFGHLGAPALGVAGAAWATVLSRIVMMVSLSS